MPLSTQSLTTNPGWDPIWEVQDPRYAMLAGQYRADDKLRQQRAQQAYEQQIYDLGQQVKTTRENTLSGLEGRGVLNSGETQRRLADIAARDAEAQARARLGLTNAQSASTNQLSQALANLAVQRQQDISDAAMRKRETEVGKWVAEVNRQQQAALLQQIQGLANRAPTVIRVPAGAPAAAPIQQGPSQADILRLYAALNPGGTAASSRFSTGARGPQ